MCGVACSNSAVALPEVLPSQGMADSWASLFCVCLDQEDSWFGYYGPLNVRHSQPLGHPSALQAIRSVDISQYVLIVASS